MYETTECAVRVNDNITDWFPTEAGIRQGQNDSPTIFAVFINSLAQKIKDMNVGVSVDERKVSILLYADDIVLIRETESELQAMLDELVVWCKTWRMKVNIEKMQIFHFRSKQTSKTETIFYLGPQALGIVNQYRYLGLILTEHMCYKATGDALAMGAGRALRKLVAKYYQYY